MKKRKKALRNGYDGVTTPETETETEKKKTCPKPSGSALQNFERFWKEWPVKENKKKAKDVWQRKRLDEHADILIADVVNRKQQSKKWREGFIPLCTTYLNGERWEDEY